MAQTERKVSFRGRRPGLATLDSRLEEVESALFTNRKISNRRLAELHEATLTLEHHYQGHKENGETVKEQQKRVQDALGLLASKMELPGQEVDPSEQTSSESVMDRIKATREERAQLLKRLEELRLEEEILYPEIGRQAVEEALGQLE